MEARRHQAAKATEEEEAERLRENEAKRRRAAAASEAALEAERLRAKQLSRDREAEAEKKIEEQLRRDREAEAERARSVKTRTEDKASAMLKKVLDLEASSEKQREKADQLRAKAQQRLDRRVVREKLAAENPGTFSGISEVDIDTSDDEDFESTVRVSADVQQLEATGWIEQIRSMWLHQLC